MPGVVSVIIPTLNNARVLARTLAPLNEGVEAGLIREVIVSDGGSRDETLAVADEAGCILVSSEAGRAKQLIAGAARAKAKYLFFLYPDAKLAKGWSGEVRTFVASAESRKRAAVFALAFDDGASKSTLFWARLRGRLMKLPQGEQSILLSRFLYDGLSGYRDTPLEDIDLVQRISGKRLTFFESEISVSPKSYRGQDGVAANLRMMTRYFLGADPVALVQREATRASSGV